MADSKRKLSPFLMQMEADFAALPPETQERILHSPRVFPTRAQIAEEEAEIAKLVEDFHLNISSLTTSGPDTSASDADQYRRPRRLTLEEVRARLTPEEFELYLEKFPARAKEHAL